LQYLGGKSRISNQISEILNKYTKDRTFYSLFCGSSSIESKIIAKEVVLNDFHPYLIEMFLDLQKGRDFPENVSEEEYKRVKENKDLDKGLSSFIGFGCSFGGKWWGGYARQTKGLNYAKTCKNSLAKKMKTLSGAKFNNLDYREVEIKNDSVIYCDPPYKGTTGYSNSSDFSHDDFWEYMRKLSENNMVFISEINAPEDFVPIWTKDFTRNLDAKVVFTSTEKLFIHKSKVDKT